MKDLEDATRLRVAALLAARMSVRDTAEEIGIAKSVVHRMKQRIEREAKEARRGRMGRIMPSRATRSSATSAWRP
jgi:transposase